MHVLADVGQSRAVSHDLEFHTFVHRLCMCTQPCRTAGGAACSEPTSSCFPRSEPVSGTIAKRRWARGLARGS